MGTSATMLSQSLRCREKIKVETLIKVEPVTNTAAGDPFTVLSLKLPANRGSFVEAIIRYGGTGEKIKAPTKQ